MLISPPAQDQSSCHWKFLRRALAGMRGAAGDDMMRGMELLLCERHKLAKALLKGLPGELPQLRQRDLVAPSGGGQTQSLELAFVVCTAEECCACWGILPSDTTCFHANDMFPCHQWHGDTWWSPETGVASPWRGRVGRAPQ